MFISMLVAQCQLLAFHLIHANTVLNYSIILWTALLSAGKKVLDRENSVTDERFPQVQLSGSQDFGVYFRALEAWLVSWCHPPDSSPDRIPVEGMKNHFKVTTVLCEEVFFPLMCPVPQGKLCAAPLLETKATSQVREINKMTSSPLWADALEN